ncbi:DUF6493 family protein [Nocardia huaxiensis]|uniref:DUF7824 domain-containing protein n=1 Tax=Nocardia huaxiensis TaxID=2755382 RepID=A0A7D6ZEU0_9NOCA|nr:DUF6493 family protein [Nocardia huaxiensis]QLY33808.1 hypothetical protein H0264_17615 [Nocardia huaxiensis]UFS99267.1 DUF6493 family protein [Nocardia huaxiensis]
MNWDELSRLIRRDDAAAVVAAVQGLDEATRKEAAGKLAGLIRRWDDIRDWEAWQRTNQNLLIAGAACLSGPAAAATWLMRSNLELRWNIDVAKVAGMVFEATTFRGTEWQLEVARRMAAKLRGTANRADTELRHWRIAAEIFIRTNTEPPTDDGFVLVWVRSNAWPQLSADPFRNTLAPRLFEVDGVGPLLQWERKGDAPRAVALRAAAAAGELDRAALLDGCVRRLLRGGTAQQLRWYVLVHDLFAPAVDELRPHERDYLRLLPTAPSTVADLAFRQLKTLDDAKGLDRTVVEEAATSLLFRTEKKLLNGTLTWLDRTARRRDRVDMTVCVVCALFSHESLDLVDRATAIAAKHVDRVSPEVREEVRAAAATLPAFLAERMIAAYGAEILDADALPALTDEFVVDQVRAITTLEQLADALTASDRSREYGSGDIEQQLAGLVELSHHDRERTKTVLAQALPHVQYAETGVQSVVRTLLNPRSRPQPGRRNDYETIPARVLSDRIDEIACGVAENRLPLLLATPTRVDGLIDPDILLARVQRYEELGLEPGPLDLKQALLRLPRDTTPTDIEAGAAPLTSNAGRALAEWLSGPAGPDPEIDCGPVTPARKSKPWHFYNRFSGYYYHRQPETRVLARVRTPELEPARSRWSRLLHRDRVDSLDELFSLPGTNGSALPGGWYQSDCAQWPSLLPSHPEVIAAHLLAGHGDMSAALPGLALAAGPYGAATATVLAHGLTSSTLEQRAVSVDALLTFIARDRLPAVALGTAIRLLAQHDSDFKLGRLATSLSDATRAGAAAALWPVFAVALPALIPAARPGLPDLIALATQSAAAAGAWQPIPEITELAGRPGSSRIVREAKRLHAQLEAR